MTRSTFVLKIQRELCHPKSFGTFEKQATGRDSNPDLCDAGAVLHQLSSQVNWELVITWVDDKPVGDGYRSVRHLKLRFNPHFKYVNFIYQHHNYNIELLFDFHSLELIGESLLTSLFTFLLVSIRLT